MSCLVEKNRATIAIGVVVSAAMAAFGLWLFWATDSDSPVLVAIGAACLVLGLTAAAAAVKGLVRLVRPGVLEQVEYESWLKASAQYREPGPFRVILESGGRKKLDAIKALRDVTGLDVGRAKSMAEATPTLVMTGVSGDSADRIAELFRDAGALVRVEAEDEGSTAAPSPG